MASFVKQIKAFVPEGQLLRVSVAVEVVEPEPLLLSLLPKKVLDLQGFSYLVVLVVRKS